MTTLTGVPLQVSRKPRENLGGAVYHVYARGNGGAEIFLDSVDRRTYLWFVETIGREFRWDCFAYCLMDNHVHLLLRTPEPNLSTGMQRIQGCYAQGWNRRHDRSGHVFQGRYGAIRLRSDAHVQAAAAYIARNPVEAGICARPEDWAWSSHRAAISADSSGWLEIDEMLSFFGSNVSVARKRYAELTSRPPNRRIRIS